ncbi:MAG: hypothetical protein FJ368_01160 [Pelagibacterales bacterium]|nr:hypothetical protein [Pelagibacterales bacterium]
MSNLIAIALTLVIVITIIKTFQCKSFYEKVISIYFASTNFITLIIVKSSSDLNSSFDMITTLLLLQVAVILFLLSKYKKNS